MFILRNSFIEVFCTQLYGIKYSYLIEIIYTQLYGFKYSYPTQTIVWFQVFLSHTNNYMVSSIPI